MNARGCREPRARYSEEFRNSGVQLPKKLSFESKIGPFCPNISARVPQSCGVETSVPMTRPCVTATAMGTTMMTGP